MEPYIGVVFYILFFFWEVILLAHYLKLIRTKPYQPQIKINEEEGLQMDYLPEEIVHMLSIEKANYFSESMAKVNSVILLKLFQNGALKTKIEESDRVKLLKVSKEKNLPKVEQQILTLFQEADKKKKKGTELQLNQMKWKVFGYQKVRDVSNLINQELKEKLKEKKLLNKTAFENIERITKEIFLNFILLFVVYGITYLSFIPTMVGMMIAILFTLCNMTLRIFGKKKN